MRGAVRTNRAIEEDGIVAQAAISVLLLQHLSKAHPLKLRPSARRVAGMRRLGAPNHPVRNVDAAVRCRRCFARDEKGKQEAIAAANLPSQPAGDGE